MRPPRISNTAALAQTSSAVAYVTTIVGRVLAKFPSDTLAPSLVAFTFRYRTSSIRISGRGDEVVLTSLPSFTKSTVLRFPVKLLDAQESEITKWAREQHWAEIRAAKLRDRQNAEAKASRARRAIAKAELELATAKSELAAITEGQTKDQVDQKGRTS